MERRCQCSCCRRSTTEELAEQLLSRLSAKSLSSAQLPLIVKLREALVTCEAQILSSVAPSIVAPRLRASWWHGAQPELKRRLLRLPEPMSISPRAAQRESSTTDPHTRIWGPRKLGHRGLLQRPGDALTGVLARPDGSLLFTCNGPILYVVSAEDGSDLQRHAQSFATPRGNVMVAACATVPGAGLQKIIAMSKSTSVLISDVRRDKIVHMRQHGSNRARHIHEWNHYRPWSNPVGLCASRGGSEVLIAESGRISAMCLRTAPHKVRRTYLAEDGLSAKGVAVHPIDGSLVIAATNQNCVRIFSSDGSDDYDDEDKCFEGFNAPMDVAVALDGTIYVADYGNDRIQIISRPCPKPRSPFPAYDDDEVEVTTLASGNQVSTPKALCLDERWGRLFVAGGLPESVGGCITMMPVPTRAERLDPVFRSLLLAKHRRAHVKTGLYLLQTLERELAHDVYIPGFPASLPVGRLVLWYAVEVVCEWFQLSTCLPTSWYFARKEDLFEQAGIDHLVDCETELPHEDLVEHVSDYWENFLAHSASPRMAKALELLTSLREPGIVANIIGFVW